MFQVLKTLPILAPEVRSDGESQEVPLDCRDRTDARCGFGVWSQQPGRRMPASSEESKTVPVRVVRPERKTIGRVIEQPGQIQPFEQTPLYARLSGYVEKVNVETIGKRVRKGEVLAELHVPEMEKELKQKQALVEQARAEIEQARKMIVVAEARITELEAARIRAKATCERWRKELRRIQDLVQRKVIDEQTRDETAHQFESAEGALQEADAHIRLAQAQLDKARADAKTAEAHLGVAEADSEQTAELLKYRQIVAPFDGIVSRRNVDPGHFVQPSSSAVSGKAMPLFVVDRMDIVRIFVEVPEADAVFVSDGSRAIIHIDALHEQEIEGKVAGTSWSLAPVERTLRTEIDLPNPEGKLRPGMYAYARISIECSGLLTLPRSAVQMTARE